MPSPISRAASHPERPGGGIALAARGTGKPHPRGKFTLFGIDQCCTAKKLAIVSIPLRRAGWPAPFESGCRTAGRGGRRGHQQIGARYCAAHCRHDYIRQEAADEPHARAALPHLPRPGRAHVRRSRHVAAVRELPDAAASSTRWRPTTRCTCMVCDKCFLVQLQDYVSPDHIFSEYASFLLLLDELGRARALLLPHDQGPPAAGAAQPRGRAGQQRRLPAPALPARAACRCWASSRRPTWPRPRDGATYRRWSEFFGTALAERLVVEGKRADLIVANNVLAQVPDAQRLRRRHEAPAGAGRRHHARVPASAAPDRREPVRHHLPRAFLLLLAGDGRPAGRAPRPQGVRRGGARDARRLAARLSGARRLRAPARRRA